MKRGEIRWYKFKAPDKKRPVLILIRDSVLEYLGEVTIAPITSTIRDIPSEVFLSKFDGMPRDCAINFDHIQTVSKGKVGSIITTLSPQKKRTSAPGNLICIRFIGTNQDSGEIACTLTPKAGAFCAFAISCKKKTLLRFAHLIVLSFSTELEGKVKYGDTAAK